MTSPALILSPSFLRHLMTVPSVIVSLNCGIVNSAGIRHVSRVSVMGAQIIGKWVTGVSSITSGSGRSVEDPRIVPAIGHIALAALATVRTPEIRAKPSKRRNVEISLPITP